MESMEDRRPANGSWKFAVVVRRGGWVVENETKKNRWRWSFVLVVCAGVLLAVLLPSCCCWCCCCTGRLCDPRTIHVALFHWLLRGGATWSVVQISGCSESSDTAEEGRNKIMATRRVVVVEEDPLRFFLPTFSARRASWSKTIDR